MNVYIVTLHHDHGMIRLRTSAESKQGAIEKVCYAEGAPETAVSAVQLIGPVYSPKETDQ